MEKRIQVNLIINDLRKSALEIAKRFARDELKIEISVLLENAKNIHKYLSNIDIALIYGYSTPHFNPWELIELLNSISKILTSDGIIIIHEHDRIFEILARIGYHLAFPEKVNENLVSISIQQVMMLEKVLLKEWKLI